MGGEKRKKKNKSRQGRLAVKKRSRSSPNRSKVRHHPPAPCPRLDRALTSLFTAPTGRSCILETHRLPLFRFRLTLTPLEAALSLLPSSRFRGLLLVVAAAGEEEFAPPPPSPLLLGRRATAAAAFAPGKYLFVRFFSIVLKRGLSRPS